MSRFSFLLKNSMPTVSGFIEHLLCYWRFHARLQNIRAVTYKNLCVCLLAISGSKQMQENNPWKDRDKLAFLVKIFKIPNMPCTICDLCCKHTDFFGIWKTRHFESYFNWDVVILDCPNAVNVSFHSYFFRLNFFSLMQFLHYIKFPMSISI